MTNQERLQANNAKIEAIQETLKNKVVTSGEIELTENNKTYDVSKYASAKTNVAVPDLSATTATAEDVREGKEFYNASGEKVAGTYKDMLQARVDNINSCAHLFESYTGNSVDFIKNLDISRIDDMRYMFDGCTNITTLPQLDTSNVTNMSYMFGNCSALTTIPQLNTSSVTNMNSMFYYCKALQNIPQLDTSKATNIARMFNNCSALTTVPQLDTSNVTAMGNMFESCIALTTVSQLDLIKATSITSMFSGCINLTNLTLKNIKKSLQIGGGTSWGTSLTDNSIVNTFQELHDMTGKTAQTLTLSTPSNARTEAIYVKLIDVTDEMRAEDQYIDNKKPCVVCESTDEGAMTLKEYGISKNWQIK